MVEKGIYRHYKGKLYEVLGTARNSENHDEIAVIYRALYKSEFGLYSIWYRPLEMFTEKVEVDGKEVPRFDYLAAKIEDIE